MPHPNLNALSVSRSFLSRISPQRPKNYLKFCRRDVCMAQKFGNARWVKEGFFDNRSGDVVVGQVTFAALGVVDFCLAGGLHNDLAGQVIQFRNPKFIDDPHAGGFLEDFAIPHIGKVSLLSFDPHPLLPPHPYFEWFSLDEQHYRFELEPDDAWVMAEAEWDTVHKDSQRIYETLSPQIVRSSS